jgi:hypothetical protein
MIRDLVTSRASALVVCKNPARAEERGRKRDELLDATEQDLKDIQARIV